MLRASLDANAVAELMPCLHAHNYPPHWEVIHAGTQAESMFFIASGMVKINTSGGETTLTTGDFFGEIAMIEEDKYQYSFTTSSKVRLLRLNREDFLRLQSAYPAVTDRIKEIASARKQARLEGRNEPRGYDEINAGKRATIAAVTDL